VPRIDSGELGRWQTLDAAAALTALADYAKRDPTFKPIKDRATTRWYATVQGIEFELLLTGPKFFDTRVKKGGGGAIDLVIYLLRVDFKTATNVLRCKGL
jgi:hypothetical protein